MPSKYENILTLYSNTLKEISKVPENWTQFLITASNNYKYSFDDQILIFVQKPEAIACADIDTWNKKVKRWVNKGSKGIALLEETNGKNKLKYVFDVSDTHNYRGTKLNLWNADEIYHEEIIKELDAIYGDLENKSNLAEAIISASNNSVEDNIQDYLNDLILSKNDSFLEDLDDFNIEILFKKILTNSVAFMTMQRCGLNPFDEFDIEDFREIMNFNTYNTISILGVATSDIAENNLRKIHSVIKNLQKQFKDNNRTFDEKQKINDNNIKEIERSDNYGTNISNDRRFPNPELNNRGNEQESNSRQVLSNEVKLFEGTQKGIIYDIKNEERITETSDGDSRKRIEQTRTNNENSNETREYNRTNERTRPNEVGANDEQFEELSRGNSDSGINLQLNLTSEDEQKKIIADISKDEISANFDFTQEMIDKTLQEGSHFEKGKFRIYRQMTSSFSSEENIKFLKHEYGIGGASSAYLGSEIGIDYDSKGIRLYYGFKDNRPEKLLSWSYVEKRIKELVQSDRYLNQKEFDEYLKWLENDTQEKISSVKEIQIEKVPNYHLGDIVYIGANQFEISNIGLFNVQLYDLNFPLLSREMSVEELEQAIKENPANEHLLKIKEKTLEEKILDLENKYDIFDREENTLEIAKEDLNNKNELINYLEQVKDAEDNNEELKTDFDEIINDIKESELIENNINNNKIQTDKLVPNLSQENRINYKISNDNLGIGTPREKFSNNIKAIKVLKKCEDENRLATHEEQEILSKYVGWGGLAKAFDENDSSWSKEYNILKDLLTDEEYENARESTLTSFYTPPIVIDSIYQALENMGLKNGNILEPSCRSWKFFRNVT